MSIQVEHQLDPSPTPQRTEIATQGTELVLVDPKRPELGWKLVERR